MSQQNQYDDYSERSGDIVGMWSPDEEKPSPIHFTPLDVIMIDSKKFDKTKPSILVFGNLLSPCPFLVAKSDEDDEEGVSIEGKEGDLIGFWYKPGMRALRDLGGVPVLLDFKRDDEGAMMEKDVDKGNPMKLYSVKSPRPGGRLQVREDKRVVSKGAKTFLDDSTPVKNEQRKPPVKPEDYLAAVSDDEVPF